MLTRQVYTMMVDKFQNISNIFMHHQHRQRASKTNEYDLIDKKLSLYSHQHLYMTDMDHKQEFTPQHEVPHHMPDRHHQTQRWH